MKTDDVNRLIDEAMVALEAKKHEWVGLTDKQINELARWADEHAAPWHLEFARAIEAKLKEKNT